MNRVLAELLQTYVPSNPPDNDVAAHEFLEYVLGSGHLLSEFSEKDLWDVANHFGLDEAEGTDLIMDAAMWLT